MKVIRQTARQLIIQQNPLVVRLMGGLIASLGLFLFISFENPVDLFGIGCIAIASIVPILAPVATCAFDKNLQRVVLKQRRGWQRRVHSYPIDQIYQVVVQRSVYVGTHFYSLKILLNSGQILPLPQLFTTDPSLPQAIASRIRQFLRLT